MGGLRATRGGVDLRVHDEHDVTAVAAVGDTLREQGLSTPALGGGTTFLQAKTANEVLKAQERRIRLQKLKGELIERARALALVFRLAREERDAWVTWPARSAALMPVVSPAAASTVTVYAVRKGSALYRTMSGSARASRSPKGAEFTGAVKRHSYRSK